MSATDSPLGDIDVNAILQEAKLNNRNAEEDVALDDDELLNAVNRVSAILARSFEQDEEKDASNEETEEERQARIEELITDLVKNGGAGTQHVHIHEYVHTDDNKETEEKPSKSDAEAADKGDSTPRKRKKSKKPRYDSKGKRMMNRREWEDYIEQAIQREKERRRKIDDMREEKKIREVRTHTPVRIPKRTEKQETEEDVWKRTEEYIKRREAKREALIKERQSQFTFSPKISASAKEINRDKETLQFFDEWSQQAEKRRQTKIDSMQRDREEKKMVECPFKPQINASSIHMTREKYGGADVVLRMEADSRRRIGKQMQNEMMKTQQAMGEDDVVEDEHIPSINPKSASMRIDIPVHQRLYDHAVQLQIEKKKLQTEYWGNFSSMEKPIHLKDQSEMPPPLSSVMEQNRRTMSSSTRLNTSMVGNANAPLRLASSYREPDGGVVNVVQYDPAFKDVYQV